MVPAPPPRRGCGEPSLRPYDAACGVVEGGVARAAARRERRWRWVGQLPGPSSGQESNAGARLPLALRGYRGGGRRARSAMTRWRLLASSPHGETRFPRWLKTEYTSRNGFDWPILGCARPRAAAPCNGGRSDPNQMRAPFPLQDSTAKLPPRDALQYELFTGSEAQNALKLRKRSARNGQTASLFRTSSWHSRACPTSPARVLPTTPRLLREGVAWHQTSGSTGSFAETAHRSVRPAACHAPATAPHVRPTNSALVLDAMPPAGLGVPQIRRGAGYPTGQDGWSGGCHPADAPWTRR